MIKLTQSEIEIKLAQSYSHWKQSEGFITQTFKFKDFIDAFAFMTAVAVHAEELNHHPNWENVYNTVKVALSTHDAGGITELDFKLAAKMDEIFNSYQG